MLCLLDVREGEGYEGDVAFFGVQRESVSSRE